MAIAIRAKRGLSRRQLLVRSASTVVLAGLGGLARPYLSRAADRPQIACGVQSGDVTTGSAVVWARADRPARMHVECSTVESLRTIIAVASSAPLPNRDFTSKTWHNIVTEEKSVGAHSLAQFRGNYKYNLPDDNLRAFNAHVPMFAQWDDHEVTNDWSPIGSADETGYAEDGTSRLVARARRAFFEFMPIRETPAQAGRVYRKISYVPLLDVFLIDMRSYRDSTWNKRDDPSHTFILGAAQLAWLKRELVASDATWKVIAADLPIGLVSEDAIALGNGPPERREHEIADLLSFIKPSSVSNTVWLTADMHYTAAHHYDPNRAVF